MLPCLQVLLAGRALSDHHQPQLNMVKLAVFEKGTVARFGVWAKDGGPAVDMTYREDGIPLFAPAEFDTAHPPGDAEVVSVVLDRNWFAHEDTTTAWRKYNEAVLKCTGDAAHAQGIARHLSVDTTFGRYGVFYKGKPAGYHLTGHRTSLRERWYAPLSAEQRAAVVPLLRRCIEEVMPAPRAWP